MKQLKKLHKIGVYTDQTDLTNITHCILRRKTMRKKALVIIDIQNDITKNYKEIIDNINKAIDCAVFVK